MDIGICKLCLEKKELLSKSHIISDLLYKSMYNKNHELIAINSANIRNHKKMNSGYYEANILCKSCDNDVIGNLETYGSSFFIGATNIKKNERPTIVDSYTIIDEDCEVKVYNQINYTKFKLFLLSILWRASISSLDFFSDVNLGKKYNEIIRKMILNQDPKKKEDYPVVIWQLEIGELSKSIVQPVKLTKGQKYTTYAFFINKYLMYFNIYENKIIKEYDKLTIQTDNIMQVPIIRGEIAKKYYDRCLGKSLRLRNN